MMTGSLKYSSVWITDNANNTKALPIGPFDHLTSPGDLVGITFQNITIAAPSVLGEPDVLWGFKGFFPTICFIYHLDFLDKFKKKFRRRHQRFGFWKLNGQWWEGGCNGPFLHQSVCLWPSVFLIEVHKPQQGEDLLWWKAQFRQSRSLIGSTVTSHPAWNVSRWNLRCFYLVVHCYYALHWVRHSCNSR